MNDKQTVTLKNGSLKISNHFKQLTVAFNI